MWFCVVLWLPSLWFGGFFFLCSLEAAPLAGSSGLGALGQRLLFKLGLKVFKLYQSRGRGSASAVKSISVTVFGLYWRDPILKLHVSQ